MNGWECVCVVQQHGLKGVDVWYVESLLGFDVIWRYRIRYDCSDHAAKSTFRLLNFLMPCVQPSEVPGQHHDFSGWH